jgi:hypothetical protein
VPGQIGAAHILAVLVHLVPAVAAVLAVLVRVYASGNHVQVRPGLVPHVVAVMVGRNPDLLVLHLDLCLV